MLALHLDFVKKIDLILMTNYIPIIFESDFLFSFLWPFYLANSTAFINAEV